jgi:hypothetical protein
LSPWLEPGPCSGNPEYVIPASAAAECRDLILLIHKIHFYACTRSVGFLAGLIRDVLSQAPHSIIVISTCAGMTSCLQNRQPFPDDVGYSLFLKIPPARR